MRRRIVGVNRLVLVVLRLALLALAVLVLLRSTGVFSQSRARQMLVTPELSGYVNRNGTLIWPVVAVVAVVVALLGLLLLLGQVPRRTAVRQIDLSDDGERGSTRVSSSTATSAFVEEVEALPGVESASARLRGDPAQPLIELSVDVDEATEVGSLLAAVDQVAVRHLVESLEVRPQGTAVQVRLTEGGAGVR